jgi:uncharacterized protein
MTSSSRPWALVTGASEGLGREFARQLAQRQTHNLIITARSEAKLQSLSKELQSLVEVKVILADLSLTGSAKKLEEETKQYQVAILINNAGVAFGGQFEDMESNEIQTLLNVNIVNMTDLFYLFIPRIKKLNEEFAEKQKTSKYALAGIVNLSSVAAYMPIPSMAIYAASKTYIHSLSESVYQEQRNAGSTLRVVTSCPGTTKTEIWTKGGANEKGVRVPLDTPEHVCQATLKALDKQDKPIIIPGYFNNLMAFGSVRLTPRSWVRIISRRAMGQDPALRDAEEVKEAFAKLGRTKPIKST